jgi:hypothetical protein
MTQKFNVGDVVKLLVQQTGKSIYGGTITAEVGDQGVIIAVNDSAIWPYSVMIVDKTIVEWEDNAWHMAAHEIELVTAYKQ